MSKRLNIILPTLEEDKEINQGIASDPDTYELSQREIREMQWMRERHSKNKSQKQEAPPIDRDIVDAFKAIGPDWQMHINRALREWLKEHHRSV
jgi:uncharacterized protein (DUF4415 family)